MVSEQFLWCRNCDAIHHVTSSDKAPSYARLGDEILETPADDWRAFMNQHAGHTLEPVKAAGEKYFPNGQAADPMAVAYVEVTNGQEHFVLRQARKNIEAPLQFAVVKGRLADGGFRLQVQETEIRKEMKHHFGGAPAQRLGDEKIDLFISLVREVVKEVDPRSIRVSDYSRTDSNVAYGQLSGTEVNALMVKCAAQFEGAELESIRRFVEAHRENSDVMTVVMRRHMAIEQPAES
jgi:hypothetical protein